MAHMTSQSLTALAKAPDSAIQIMFEARKRVFVDLLKWHVPVVEDRYEIDQFDTADATYLVLLDEAGRHRASTRLLQTDRPHILADLFPFLCAGAVPIGPTTREITRFCLEPRLTAGERRKARNELVTALAEFAICHGITDLTGVASPAWFQQIAAFGWRCRVLGPAVEVDGRHLVGLQICIDADTLGKLERAGNYLQPSGRLTIVTGASR